MTRQVNYTQLPELQHELFQWWVDLTQHLHARVATSAIMAQAELIRKDALEAEVVNPARVPKITRMWIARWRRYFSIVPRAITCTYKVSYQSKLNRMGVLWRNAARLLAFHEHLFGPGKLTFVSMNEKPCRFHSCGGDKVCVIRGRSVERPLQI